MLTLFAGHRHRMTIALKSKSDVCSVQVVPLRLADDRVSQSAAWTKTGRPSRHSQTWPCRGNVESQHVDLNSFETAQILIQWSNRSFCHLPSTQLTYPLCLRWLFLTEPWLCGCLGFPCTITRLGHISFNSVITSAVNSLLLSLCKIEGAPKRRKISNNWCATAAARLQVSLVCRTVCHESCGHHLVAQLLQSSSFWPFLYSPFLEDFCWCIPFCLFLTWFLLH